MDKLDGLITHLSLTPKETPHLHLPIFHVDEPGIPKPKALKSELGYFAHKTLHDLALASDDVLWEVYGSLISKWQGSTAGDVLGCLRDEINHVQEFRNKMDPKTTAQTISDIRKALATVNLILVPSSKIPTFARYVSVDEEELEHVVALHHCSEDTKNTIFLLPFLLRVEELIRASHLSPNKAYTPGHDLDTAIVTTAKTMIHESRHLVGTLIHGVPYFTPKMVQGSFSPPLKLNERTEKLSSDDVGEGGDWYEVSRYGAYLSPALVSPENDGLSAMELVLTGHHSEGGNPHQPYYLLSPTIEELADEIRNGTFIIPSQFFNPGHTVPVIGYIRDIADFNRVPNPTTSSQPQPTPSLLHHTNAARPSGPYTYLHQSPKLASSFTDVRKMGYGNFRGVTRDRKQG